MNDKMDEFKRSFEERILRNNEIEDNVLGPVHKYGQRLQDAISEKGSNRLVISMNDIRTGLRDNVDDIMRNPRPYMYIMQQAAIEYTKELDPAGADKALNLDSLQVGFEDVLNEHTVSPRGLTSALLKHLVVVEGIVTKCGTVKPKLTRSVHLNTVTNEYESRAHRDDLSLDVGFELGEDNTIRMPTPNVIPEKDKDGNKLETEFGLSTFKDVQTIILQEMPERARVGQLPRSVEVVLEHDLVDRVKPGDRVNCVGVYRPLPAAPGSSTFPTKLVCNNISILGKDIGGVKVGGDDITNIKTIAERKDVLDVLARSLCPSIFGHEHIKKALVLQLLGGCERTLANKTHLRGDINIMVIGDPSTAKSQLLRSVMDIAPLAVSTTGRGSSGVGLTAAVASDADSGERVLEAGATVLADRGVVCIDEFDKMSENDRVAIHEVMEQQTVTIAKAGIHATLNARCSVLAAANPVYGQYDRSRRPQENIGLPDSLLSRFDLLFIVLDQLDPAMDRRLSEHVIKSHQYRRSGQTMEPEPLNVSSTLNLTEVRAERTGMVWQQGRGGSGAAHSSRLADAAVETENDTQILTKEFMRKYIFYAKSKRPQPVLSEEAMALISETYATMRSKQNQRTLPVTARSLETLIRLSSACAKIRLSSTVDEEDVEVAKDLVHFVLYSESQDEQESAAAQQAAAFRLAQQGASAVRARDEDGNTSGEDDAPAAKRLHAGASATGTPASQGLLSQSQDGRSPLFDGSQSQNQGPSSMMDLDTRDVNLDPDSAAYQAVTKTIIELRKEYSDSVPFAVVVEAVSSGGVGATGVKAVLEDLQTKNHLLLDGDAIMFVD